MFEFLNSPKFVNAINSKQATLFINPGLPEVTWQEVLQFVNDYEDKRTGKTLLPSPYAFFHNEAQIISSVNSFVKEVHSRYTPCFKDTKVVTCQLFGSTKLEDGQIIHKHEDRENNLFWQGRGRSRWRLYDSEDNPQPFMDIVLEDGDLLFVPGGTYHYVEPLTPRFGFAILFGDKK
jgi:cupin superfamily acireductone dioxygenase involved in methionine salvage